MSDTFRIVAFLYNCGFKISGGKKAVEEHAAVWVPDDEAPVCMHCKKSKFTLTNRRVSTDKTLIVMTHSLSKIVFIVMYHRILLFRYFS